MKKYLVLLLSSSILFSCDYEPSKDDQHIDVSSPFPEKVSLSTVENTVFLPTLESSFSPDNNGIYSASLMLAWQEIQDTLHAALSNFTSPQLETMYLSKSHKKVLAPNEYETEIKVEGPTIIAKASFAKSLPFKDVLTKDSEAFLFDSSSVRSFSFFGEEAPAQIIYYNSDDDFAIKIFPEDRNHEIILHKVNLDTITTLNAVINKIFEKTVRFKNTQNDTTFWKEELLENDHVKIPCLSFNIDHDYPEIVTSTFSTSSGKSYVVLKAYQRTAFVLNEKGAEIESEAEMAVTESASPMLKKPKNLYFDSSFIIMLKRKNAHNPYFAAFITNDELMVPFKK